MIVQKISLFCVLVSYSNLVLIVITWHTTMDDLSQPMIKIIMPGPEVTVLKVKMVPVMVMVVDGSSILVPTVCSPQHPLTFIGTQSLAP